MVLNGKFSKALKTLQHVAAFNGKKEEGEKLSLEVGAERDFSQGQDPVLCSRAALHLPLLPLVTAHIPSDPPN